MEQTLQLTIIQTPGIIDNNNNIKNSDKVIELGLHLANNLGKYYDSLAGIGMIQVIH